MLYGLLLPIRADCVHSASSRLHSTANVLSYGSLGICHSLDIARLSACRSERRSDCCWLLDSHRVPHRIAQDHVTENTSTAIQRKSSGTRASSPDLLKPTRGDLCTASLFVSAHVASCPKTVASNVNQRRHMQLEKGCASHISMQIHPQGKHPLYEHARQNIVLSLFTLSCKPSSAPTGHRALALPCRSFQQRSLQ